MFTKRPSILHVDDDALFTQLVKQHFLRAGYESETLNSPANTIPTLIRGEHRIAVLDVQMPKKSGLQLLQEIKQYDAGIQVILLTSRVAKSTVVEAARLGAEACLFKPLTNAQPLLDAIEHAHERCCRWHETARQMELLQAEESGEPAESFV